MSRRASKGFAVFDFLLSSVGVFCGFYFIFWTSFLGSNYALSRHYLNDFTLCQLNTNSNECWFFLTRRLKALKFMEITNLDLQTTTDIKTVSLVFNYSLPMPGASKGIQSISLSQSINMRDWQ